MISDQAASEETSNPSFRLWTIGVLSVRAIQRHMEERVYTAETCTKRHRLLPYRVSILSIIQEDATHLEGWHRDSPGVNWQTHSGATSPTHSHWRTLPLTLQSLCCILATPRIGMLHGASASQHTLPARADEPHVLHQSLS